jgi:hypothetical protein
MVSINNLRISTLQTEDALSQGLEKLQQIMIKNIQADSLDFGYHGFHVAAAIDKGEVVESFVNQVKHPLNFHSSIKFVPEFFEIAKIPLNFIDVNQFRPSIFCCC